MNVDQVPDEDDSIFCMDYNGGRIVLYREHQYHKIRNYKNSSSVLRCSTYKKTKCPGKITVKDKRVISEKPHKCQVDPNKNLILKEKAALKSKVISDDRPIPKLYAETVDGLMDKGLNFVTEMPVFKNMKHFLYDARKKVVGTKKSRFEDLNEVEIPQIHTEFLMADYYDDGDRILIFCSPELRLQLCSIKEYFIDATFKSCPKPFTQLLSIHGDFGSTQETVNVKPLVFALMPNKKQATYEKIFHLIQSSLIAHITKDDNFKWTMSKVHCDFEAAIINAIAKFFPKAAIRGCYYHWNKNMWRKGKLLDHKLKAERRIVGLAAALPLLPQKRILEGWQYIKEEVKVHNLKMPKFTKYLDRLLGKKSKIPSVLSVFGERHRTNNYLEGWHSKLNKAVNKNTVNVWRLLNALKVIVSNSKMEIANGVSAKRKKDQIINDDVIRSVQMQLVNGEICLGHALDKLR